ncbi:uncharacterized protein LOC126900104 isoform X2 [Daktulosphaira vitifoliae]|uniref:uncharacterized protein LOC126900104 isoform X2 n=1 Tax=Daktulosphaira vitifoliae TaxID=58002 RepID=UPI0021A98D8D|nr:uncharacterized protein LOC126900104 isoform X2 [Daktulosphaira vitifoliae]
MDNRNDNIVDLSLVKVEFIDEEDETPPLFLEEQIANKMCEESNRHIPQKFSNFFRSHRYHPYKLSVIDTKKSNAASSAIHREINTVPPNRNTGPIPILKTFYSQEQHSFNNNNNNNETFVGGLQEKSLKRSMQKHKEPPVTLMKKVRNADKIVTVNKTFHKCRFCSKTYIRPGYLIKHEKLHTDDLSPSKAKNITK